MGMTLACKDLGAKDCSYVARGETMAELMVDGATHGIEVHDMTEEEYYSPESVEKIKSLVKKE